MLTVFLWFNAICYLALGLWCALAVDKTSNAVGFKTLDASGRCEFTAVYGGLEVSLGLMFALLAMSSQAEMALWFSLLLYAPLVLFRIIGLLRFWPVAGLTLAFAGFELAMLAIVMLLWIT